MESPQENAENLLKVEGKPAEHKDHIQKSLEKLRSLSMEDRSDMLHSRIDEQSSLILILKQRADELLLRFQAVQKINMELESQAKDYQKDLDSEKKKGEILESRFTDLAANNQGIISFMEEYKSQNAQLKVENKKLRLENEALFSKKLQDKEMLVQKLLQEIKQLTEKNTNMENEYREKLAECQSKLLEQATLHEAKEASLVSQLHNAQKEQRDAVKRCTGLTMKLLKAEEEHDSMKNTMSERITSLTKEKDTLFQLSMERGKVIQEKQTEIQQLEKKWKEEKKARVEAEKRFEQEAAAVNADVKVKSLQAALDDSAIEYETFKKECEGFKKHSANLLSQERELNKKLRQIVNYCEN